MRNIRMILGFLAAIVICGLCSGSASAQQTAYPKPTKLPNPYRLVKGWPTLPASMNDGHWGEVSRVHVDHDGNIWVLHRCFAVEPPGTDFTEQQFGAGFTGVRGTIGARFAHRLVCVRGTQDACRQRNSRAADSASAQRRILRRGRLHLLAEGV